MAYYTLNTVRIYASLQNVNGKTWENEELGKNGQTRFRLDNKSVKSIISFIKNGTALTEITTGSPAAGQFKFLAPKYVDIHSDDSPSAATDVFHCTYDDVLSDTYIETIGDGVDKIINLILCKKYALPFSAVPPAIAEISNRLTAYEIYYRNKLDKEHIAEFSNKYSTDKQRVYTFLEKIASGTYSLTADAGTLIDMIRAFPFSSASDDEPFMRFWGPDGIPDEAQFLSDVIDDYELQARGKTFDELI